MSRWIVLALACWLAGCASGPGIGAAEPLFTDAAFNAPSEPIDASQAMAASPAMREFAQRELAGLMGQREPQRALLRALYADNQLRLRYDNALTRNAAEAFEARAGNCMSLVMMTAALARELGLPVRFQSVRTLPTWGRQGDIVFSIGHINLAVGRPLIRQDRTGDGAGWTTVDFLPQQDLGQQRHTVVGEDTVIAMYMNNKAAEALAAGRVDDAYWWARAALRQDRQLLIAYNTLGVVYQRRGLPERAEQALRYAHALQPDDAHALGNLTLLLEAQGRSEEARPLRQALLRLQPEAPFADFEQGRRAMAQGDYRLAKRLFERELRRDPDYHEFHFWLALAHLKLGEIEPARQHLVSARDQGTTLDQQALYAAKLARLKQRAAAH